MVQFVNRAGEEFFARSLKEITGKKFRELFPEEKIISGLIKRPYPKNGLSAAGEST